MTHQDDLREGSLHEATKRRAVDTVSSLLEHEREALNDERVQLAAEKLRLQEKAKPAWWVDWLKPAALIPLVILVGSAYWSTTRSLSDLSAALDKVSARLDRDERDTADRVRDLVPIIRTNEMTLKQSQLIDQQQNERIEAIAQSVLQLRQSSEALRDAVQKTHEELVIEKAMRSQKDSRVLMRPNQHAPTPADVAADSR